MNIVWFLSYLCTFLLGGIATIATAYYLIERSDRKAEKATVASKNLQENLSQYQVPDPRLN